MTRDRTEHKAQTGQGQMTLETLLLRQRSEPR